MSFEEEVSRRLDARADAVSATPDLGEVIAGAHARRRRIRRFSVGGAAIVVAVGVGGVLLVANRDPGEVEPTANAEPVVTAEPIGTAPPADAALPVATDLVPVSTIFLNGDTQDFDPNPRFDPDTPDPALDFLDRTTEIYRRTLPNGYDLQVRVSDVSYGELFDLEWAPPTGSAEECLGSPAVFVGDTALRFGLTAWSVRQWDPLDAEQSTMVEGVFGGVGPQVVLIRTSLPALEAVISGADGDFDRAPFVNGVVALTVPEIGDSQQFEFGPIITLVTEADFSAAPELLEFPIYGGFFGQRVVSPGCQAGPLPGQSLPAPGGQPADPAASEAEIREVHAILVDRSIASEDKPEGLLDDNTGVVEAREQMNAGQFAESAEGAEYTIEEFVFTDPETAWFRYRIDAPTGVFPNRFGQSTFNGEVWQITRQTICQDMSLAQGYCEADGAPTPSLLPPDQIDLDAAMEDFYQLSDLYFRALYCNPISPCDDISTFPPPPD